MNPKLADINGIISTCDAMIEEIHQYGELKGGNQNYESYKWQIKRFLQSNNLIRRDYGPYVALAALYYQNRGYTVNLSEARTIREIVVSLKHELFPDSFEKIFISHREKDKYHVDALVELLYAIGIPRPTAHGDDRVIFCTSHPAAYIDNGERNLDTIKSQLNGPEHVFFIMWYSDSYFESQACLNEAGAIWAMGKRYQEILAPSFDSSKIGGLTDKQPVWIRANDKYRLNTFKAQLESMFCLDPLDQNAWEASRDAYISKVS
ncbi:MAG: toll/interleukin-1 receptor domain-containing protein [Atopobiaceae bacterium]|nr:toll/interleukin-1 receptor domain-containing protein [Atopobiaceae bacterium]